MDESGDLIQNVKMRMAFEAVLDDLGSGIKEALLYYLQERHNFHIYRHDSFSPEQLELALRCIMGEAATLIMNLVHLRLKDNHGGNGV